MDKEGENELTMLRKLIALCLTDGRAAVKYSQEMPAEIAARHSLVRAVANYNQERAAQIPSDGVVIGEIIDEMQEQYNQIYS